MSVASGGERAGQASVETAWCHPAFDRMTDLVVAIDAAATLRYVNPAAQHLLGLTATEHVGRSIAEYLHPEDLDRAAQVIGMLQDGGLGVPVTPASYRVRHRDGHWVPLDINAAEPVPDGPDRGLVVLVGRYAGDAELQSKVLELLASNAPMDDIVALIPQFGTWRHPHDHYAVRYRRADGTPTGTGSPTVVDLMDHFEGSRTPWAVAERGETAVIEPADLPDDLRRAAAAAGLQTCWVLPVPDPLGKHHAVLIAWSATPVRPLVHRYALETMSRSLQVILQWRSHVAELEQAARTDPLTGVANRAAFFTALTERLERKPTGVGVLVVDLDKFKPVNDLHGHRAGDAVLAEVSARIEGAVRRADLVARVGGDEFAVLLGELRNPREADAVAGRIVDALSKPVDVRGTEMVISASVGVAVTSTGQTTLVSLLEEADRALYQVKSDGGSGWHRHHA